MGPGGTYCLELRQLHSDPKKVEVKHYSKSNVPIHLLVGAVVIATLTTSWLGWLTYGSSDDLIELHSRHEEIARLQGTVAQYDEVLTMSARMGAATGDAKWAQRYNQFVPGLDAAIKRLVEIQPTGVRSAQETDVANLKLVELETQAFALIQKNKNKQAMAVLFSESYLENKKTYSDGMAKLYKDINFELDRERNKHKEKLNLLRITLLTLLAISALGWLFVFQRIRRWNEDLCLLNESLDAKVKEQTTRLVSSSKMSALGEMAGGVAHEINNPLATIKTLSGQLQDLVDDDPIDKALLKEMAVKIENTTDRIAKIVLGLRSFSRDGSKDSYASVNVRQLIDETLSICSERFKNIGTSLFVEKVAEDIEFEGRKTEISQVLLNLLNNASDAISDQKEKWIKISVLKRRDWVEINVTDCGKGISADIQTKIFQPFFTTKDIGKGTGMGLSISMGIVQSHGGELKLDSQCPNTCFVIRIPLKKITKTARAAA